MKYRLMKEVKKLILILSIGFGYAVWCIYTGMHIPCIFNKLTKLKCPACGATHMILALFHGDIANAFAYNPVLLILLPFILLLYIINEIRYIRCGRRKLTFLENTGTIFCIIILLLFGIIRNVL